MKKHRPDAKEIFKEILAETDDEQLKALASDRERCEKMLSALQTIDEVRKADKKLFIMATVVNVLGLFFGSVGLLIMWANALAYVIAMRVNRHEVREAITVLEEIDFPFESTKKEN